MKRFFTLNPLSIAGIYILFGFVWIILSDLLVEIVAQDISNVFLFQTVKGLVYVLVTGGLVFLLVKKFSQRIRQNEYKLKVAEEVAGMGHWTYDAETGRIEWGTQTYRLFGIPESIEPITREKIASRIHPDDLNRIREATRRAIEDGIPYDIDFRVLNTEGYRYLNGQCRIMKTGNKKIKGLYGTVIDIDDRVRKEQILEKTLEEKNTLIQEIHHRVKNNLAIISGLLQMQLFNSEKEEINTILEDSLMRIYSIALIHERLYKSGTFTRVSNKEYIEDLIKNIRQTFQNESVDITVEQNVEDFSLNINQAVPCAMLINELITNAFRHAFKKQQKGTINVEMHQNGDLISLTVSDNGIGLPESYSPQNATSLGMKLINLLAGQLDGELTFDSAPGKGTSIKIQFRKIEKKGSTTTLVKSDELLDEI